MARAHGTDPYQGANFWVTMADGGGSFAAFGEASSPHTEILAGFVTCSIPELTVESIEYKTGRDKWKRKFPGNKTVNDLTLTRGVMKAQNDFYQLAMQSQRQTQDYRFDMDIIQNHRDGTYRIYHLQEAFVSRCKAASDLDANAADVAVEEMDVIYESFWIEEKSGADPLKNSLLAHDAGGNTATTFATL